MKKSYSVKQIRSMAAQCPFSLLLPSHLRCLASMYSFVTRSLLTLNLTAISFFHLPMHVHRENFQCNPPFASIHPPVESGVRKQSIYPFILLISILFFFSCLNFPLLVANFFSILSFNFLILFIALPILITTSLLFIHLLDF